MRIEKIEIYHIAMPLISPFTTAYGSDEVIESVLVKLESSGEKGWGEASPLRCPAYSPECAAGVFFVAKEFIAPLILGKDVNSGDEIQNLMSCVKGNFFAKSGFDMAWWDLNAKLKNEPLWKIIGGKHELIDSGADFGFMENIEMLLKHIEEAIEAGYKRVKLKYGPGWDINMIDAVRKRFPHIVMHIDCNSAYSLDDIDMFRKLDEYNLAMIEQPLSYDDLIFHAELQARIKTPICLDESITSPDKAKKAVKINACKVINIKPGRVGGTTNALKIHTICREAQIPCWIGGMLESSLGAAHCLALASLPNIKYPCDIFPSTRFYKDDIAAPVMTHSAPSQFEMRKIPGVGAKPLAEKLKKVTLEKYTT